MNADAAEFHGRMRDVLEFYRLLGFEFLPEEKIRVIMGKVVSSPGEERKGDAHVCADCHAGSKVMNRDDIPGEIDTQPVPEPQVSASVHHQGIPHNNKREQLEALREEIGDCRKCRLHTGRTNIVFGEGNPDTLILFIGEGPGRDEDIQGRPFVGEAGKILTNLITKMGEEGAKRGKSFTREDVFIANIVKCRPPQNRDPLDDEIGACLPYLERQISIISPRVIMSLGKISAHTLMRATDPPAKFAISKIRGRFFDYPAPDMVIPVMPTFHPAYFLRNPKQKTLTWDDAMAVLDRIYPKKGPS